MIDTSTPLPDDTDDDMVETFTAFTRHLAAACQRNGVGRLVRLTIDGIHDAGLDDFEYYVAQRAGGDAGLSRGAPHADPLGAVYGVRPQSECRDQVLARGPRGGLADPADRRGRGRPGTGPRRSGGPSGQDGGRSRADPYAGAHPRTARGTRRRAAGRDGPGDMPAFGDGTLLASADTELRAPSVAARVGEAL